MAIGSCCWPATCDPPPGSAEPPCEDDRALLDLAAVIGRRFTLQPLAYISARDEVQLMREAGCTGVTGAIAPRPGPSAVLRVQHDLMRRAAYEALSEPRRRVLPARLRMD